MVAFYEAEEGLYSLSDMVRSVRGCSVNNVALAAAILVFLFVIGFWALRLRDLIQGISRVPEIFPDEGVHVEADTPLISVIVPAHNEEVLIRECLQSVLDQDYPRFEVICVDDRSGDRTSEIVREIFHNRPNCRLVRVKALPEGWTGKCHALDVAVRFARGEWLAFLDADSALEKSALRQSYNQAVTSGVNLISLTPNFVMRTFWEKVLQPIFSGTLCILFPLGRVNDPASEVACANGMFYVISRHAYEKIGGHRDVRDLAVEDIGIGKRVKAMGLGIIMANGRRVMQTRMYTNFRDTVKGWVRILSASMNYELSTAIRQLVIHVLVSVPVSVAALYVYVPTAMQIWPNYWFILPLLCALGMALVTSLFFRNLGIPGSYGVFMGVGNLVLIWVLAIIVKKILFKDCLQWRGTTYASTLYEPRRLDPEASRDYAPLPSRGVLEKVEGA